MNNLDAINEFTFLIYIFFSWLFLAFSIIVIKQKRVDIARRRNIAGFDACLGIAFCFAAMRVATGGAELYMYLVIIACFGFTYFAAKKVLMIIQLNKALRENDKTE